MTTYYLAKKFVNAKTYSKEDITKRVNMFYMFAQLSSEEYEELMTLIDENYLEEA